MRTKLLKISMMITALIFLFTGASWAEGGKNRQRNNGPEKRIESKGQAGSSYRQPVHYKPKINRQQKHFYKNNRSRHRPTNRYRDHKFYHRNKWIRNRPQNRHGRHYSDSLKWHRWCLIKAIRFLSENMKRIAVWLPWR